MENRKEKNKKEVIWEDSGGYWKKQWEDIPSLDKQQWNQERNGENYYLLKTYRLL